MDRKESIKEVLRNMNKLHGVGASWFHCICNKISDEVGDDVTIQEILECIEEIKENTYNENNEGNVRAMFENPAVF